MSEIYFILLIVLGIGIYFYHKDSQLQGQKIKDLEKQLKILSQGKKIPSNRLDESSDLSSKEKLKNKPKKKNEKKQTVKHPKKLDQQTNKSLPKLERSGRSREFDSATPMQRNSVIRGWLFADDLDHRIMDEVYLGLDPKKSKGFQSMGILHYLGLKKEFKGIFKDSITDDVYEEDVAIELMKNDPQDFSEILYYLTDDFIDDIVDEFDEKHPEKAKVLNEMIMQKEASKLADENETSYSRFLHNKLDIFKVEDLNSSYKGGIKNYLGYKIDLDEFRKHNLANDRPAHYKLPYTQEEIDAVQKESASGKTMDQLKSYFQRRESVLRKIIDGDIEPSPQFLKVTGSTQQAKEDEISKLLPETMEEIAATEESSIRENLNQMRSAIREKYPNVREENQFLTDEIILLLLEKRPTNKKKLAIVLGGLRSQIDDQEFASSYKDVIEILKETPPEYLDEFDAEFEELLISREEGKAKLLEIRERYRAQFPKISSEEELLKDFEIQRHLHLNTMGDETDLSAKEYFIENQSDGRRAQITNAILEAGYDLDEAYTNWLEEIFDVLILVDHKKKV